LLIVNNIIDFSTVVVESYYFLWVFYSRIFAK